MIDNRTPWRGTLAVASFGLAAVLGLVPVGPRVPSGPDVGGAPSWTRVHFADGAACAATRHDVIARTFEFDPRDLVVAAGDTVQWIWESGTHTVTEGTDCTVDDPLFNAELIPATPTFRYVFDEPGRVDYFCIPHCLFMDMTGSVTVARGIPGRVFRADADGSQMIPPIESEATALLRAYLSSGQDRLHIQVTVQNLVNEMIGCHLHLGPAGSKGPMIYDLGLFADSMAVDIPLIPAYRTPLAAGNIYLAIHTVPYPAGEIRGQLLPQAAYTLEAALDAGEETNPVDSDGIGFAAVYLWPDLTRLHLDMEVSRLTSPIVGSHIHEAPSGQDGPIRFDLGAFTTRIVRDVALTPAQAAALLDGLYYINVHTEDFPLGEIRGQIGQQTVASTPWLPPAAAPGLLLSVTPTVTRGPLALDLDLAEPGPVRVDAFDVAGRRLGGADFPGAAGRHTLRLDLGPDLGVEPSHGRIYLRLRSGAQSGTASVLFRP